VTRGRTTFLAFSLVCFALTSIIACEIRVRDSAFRTSRDIHKLCVIADSADQSAEEAVERMNQWLHETDDAFNLEIVQIDAGDPETNWRSLGMPSAPPSLPVTVLVGRDNGIAESFIIDHWEPAPTDDELAAILDSPVRRQLAHELAKNVAVLLFAPSDPGDVSSVSGELQSMIETGIADERIGLSLITIDRRDPAERLLCRFMGLRGDSPDTLCVAFGRGKLMTPPLVGDEIDVENVAALVTQIRQACSCSQPLPTMGVDLPLVWSDAIDSSVVLMDQELDLSELEAEVANMLAAKAVANVSGNPTVVQIPSGRTEAQETSQTGHDRVELEPDAVVATDQFAAGRLTNITVGLAGLFAIGLTVVLVFSRARRARFDSSN
jgi:hypothetical protein